LSRFRAPEFTLPQSEGVRLLAVAPPVLGGLFKEDACRSAFRVFDKDGDGKVTTEELKAVLGDAGVRDLAGQDKLGEMMREVWERLRF
jgi:hypothetical protein